MNAPVSKSKPLKIRKIGNSLGVVLNKELLDALGVVEGDTVFPVRTPEGIVLTPYDPELEEVVKAYEQTRRQYRNALRELAK